MHPYLRAYMAGVALPTMLMPIVIVGLRLMHPADHGFAVEELLVFPIGLAPNAWGLWNVLYVWLTRHRRIPQGLFGAGLVLVIFPGALAIQMTLDKFLWTRELVAVGLPLTLGVYYLAWKHVVAWFNELLGIG
jgi:hypothetical protein